MTNDAVYAICVVILIIFRAGEPDLIDRLSGAAACEVEP